MKALLALGWYFPDSVGGTEVYVQGLAHRLAARGISVSIAAPQPDLEAPTSYEHDGLQIFRYPVAAPPSKPEAQGQVPARGAEHLHAHLRAHQPDVFHMHTIRTGLGLHELHAAKDAGCRIVVTNHQPSLGWLCQRGTLMRWGQEPCDGICRPVKCAACELQHRGLPRLAAQGAAVLSRATGGMLRFLPGRVGSALSMTGVIGRNLVRQQELVAGLDQLLVLNEQARQIALAHGAPADKVRLCRLGVSLPGLEPKPDAPTTTPLRVGFVARLHPTKGADVLIQAVRALPADAPIELELCGPHRAGADDAYVQSLRERARGDDRIRFRDPVPGDAVASLLRSYDVLCCPSVWFENGPTVALEARAVGTPVIGSDMGNLAELIRDRVDGALTPPLAVDALRDVLTRLIDDPSIVDDWRRNLPNTRTMDDIADDTLAAYRDVLGSPSA